MKNRIDEESEKIKDISADLISTIKATEKGLLSSFEELKKVTNTLQEQILSLKTDSQNLKISREFLEKSWEM